MLQVSAATSGEEEIVIARPQGRQQVQKNLERQRTRGELVEQVQNGLVRDEHLLAVARLAGLVIPGQSQQRLPLGDILRVLGKVSQLRPGCNLLQLNPICQHADQRHRFVDRHVRAGIHRMRRDGHVQTGVELKAQQDPPDLIKAVARHDAQVVARIVVTPAGRAISRCRVERSDGLTQSRCCNSRLARTVMHRAP